MTKFRNTPVQDRGRTVDSIGERNHGWVLEDRQRRGEITDLQRQVTYPMRVDGQDICTFTVDYQYIERSTGRIFVEDFKSDPTRQTEAYAIRVKLLLALYPGLEYREVTKASTYVCRLSKGGRLLRRKIES